MQIRLIHNHEFKYGSLSGCLVHSDLKMIDVNNNVIKDSFFKYRKIDLPDCRVVNKIISHNGVMGCTILMNKALKDQVLPFPNKLNVHDYWIAIVNELVGKRITIKEPLVLYRIHSHNSSNSIEKIISKKSFLKKYFNKDSLPFVGLKREDVLEELINRFQVSKKNQYIIFAFIDYLKNNGNVFKTFYFLIKYDLIRQDFQYRLKIFIKLLQRNLHI